MAHSELQESGTYPSADAAMRSEMRTRPDVASGVRSDEESGRVRLISYEPGNGVRYRLMLSDLSDIPGASMVLGGPRDVMIWVCNYGRGIILKPGPVDHHEVRTALGCSIFDAVVMSELMGFLTGREAVSVDQFLRASGA